MRVGNGLARAEKCPPFAFAPFVAELLGGAEREEHFDLSLAAALAVVCLRGGSVALACGVDVGNERIASRFGRVDLTLEMRGDELEAGEIHHGSVHPNISFRQAFVPKNRTVRLAGSPEADGSFLRRVENIVKSFNSCQAKNSRVLDPSPVHDPHEPRFRVIPYQIKLPESPPGRLPNLPTNPLFH